MDSQKTDNDILIQRLDNPFEREKVSGVALDFESINPQKELLGLLRQKSKIDYEKCSALLKKLITQT